MSLTFFLWLLLMAVVVAIFILATYALGRLSKDMAAFQSRDDPIPEFPIAYGQPQEQEEVQTKKVKVIPAVTTLTSRAISVGLGLTAGNYLYQLWLGEQDWGVAFRNSYYQVLALFVLVLVCKVGNTKTII